MSVMQDILSGWTTERITLLAPDATSAKSGQRLADPHDTGWLMLGYDGYTAWGTYGGSAEKPYEIKLDVLKLEKDEYSWHCTCPSRKSPCKHILALLYRLVAAPDSIPRLEAPAHIQQWLSQSAQKARKQAERSRRGDDQITQKELDRGKRYQARKDKITAGLEELDLWIINLIRRGLADPQVQSYTFWDSRAERMVDAQAPGIAAWLREIGSIPHQHANWIEPMLDQLGRLYLLIESFKRFDLLSPETQSDIRTVLGWHIKRTEIENSGGIEDTWVVIGRYTAEMSERLRTQRVWLRGRDNGQDALIQEFAFGDALFETHLLPGWSIRARLVYYPSGYPLRAFIGERFSDVIFDHALSGRSINASIVEYSHALARNPWLPQFPFLLDNVITVRQDDEWHVREGDGTYLPLSNHFQHTWALMALSGGHPIQVSGEWDGSSLYPTGAVVDDRFVDFGLIGKV